MNASPLLGRRCGGARGFVLIEVMAAIMILGILVAGLCAGLDRSRNAAAGLRRRATDVSTVDVSASEDPWSWGCVIGEACWDAGPRLTVGVGSGCGSECLIGIWADGWAVGEWRVSRGEGLELNVATWTGLADSELVIRARVDEGEWGPPYRTIVPDMYGGLSGPLADSDGESAQSDAGDFASVMHARCAAAPAVFASWSGAPVIDVIQDLLLVLDARISGVHSLEAYGVQQAWVGRQSRSLDVYW